MPLFPLMVFHQPKFKHTSIPPFNSGCWNPHALTTLLCSLNLFKKKILLPSYWFGTWIFPENTSSLVPNWVKAFLHFQAQGTRWPRVSTDNILTPEFFFIIKQKHSFFKDHDNYICHHLFLIIDVILCHLDYSYSFTWALKPSSQTSLLPQ